LLLVILAGSLALGGLLPDLDALRSAVASVGEWKARNGLLAAALFFVIYVVITAFSLPFAVWMTLAAGALFGIWQGTLLVSFASAIGATLAFLAARYLLRGSVKARFGDRLRAIDDGMRRDGAFYLFTLRLIPAVPFFLVNLLMGLTAIRVPVFFGVSQIAMLPATLVYVNAGTQIAALDSLSGIVSPALLLSFAALGVFPWIARLAVGVLRRRRLYARWPRPNLFDRNLVVIGGGSAGLVSAYIAAAVKAKVTLVEAAEMGGDCLNTGCIPSKTLLRSAKVAHLIRTADRVGLEPHEPVVPFREVMARVNGVIARIAPHDSVERYEGLGVEVLKGRARIRDPWTVDVALNGGGERTLSTRAIVIATGAEPVMPPIPGLADVGPLTSETLWRAMQGRDAPPARLAVLGGGPIGCELAQAFQRLGSQVTLIEMAPRILIREDEEVAELVAKRLAAEGVTLLTGHKAARCGVTEGARWIEAEPAAGGPAVRVPFDEILVAVGRKARLEGFGLEELGIPAGKVVETNVWLETRFPNIYAAGDVAGPYQFTHTAGHQAWFASVNALFGNLKRFKVDYRVIPAVTFTDPEVARVGLSEAEAKAAGVAYEVTRYDLSRLDRALADATAEGFVKVLTPPGRDRILGAVIVGEHAGELLATFTLAIKHRLGLNRILGTVHPYPTYSEAAKFAAGDWRKAHVNPTVLRVLDRFHRRMRGGD
jgi:pyruvate/2-oxoglutarate dehydrogenase complex dihydrolipoamide dehydrogenase (E3) component/uncharacterized membrane protein YdjX (TVP38/TMEM64 family)